MFPSNLNIRVMEFCKTVWKMFCLLYSGRDCVEFVLSLFWKSGRIHQKSCLGLVIAFMESFKDFSLHLTPAKSTIWYPKDVTLWCVKQNLFCFGLLFKLSAVHSNRVRESSYITLFFCHSSLQPLLVATTEVCQFKSEVYLLPISRQLWQFLNNIKAFGSPGRPERKH